MSEIPDRVTDTEGQGQIPPPSMASIPRGMEAPETTPYVISFAKYSDKVCEISLLNSNKARRAIENLKKIGTEVRSAGDFQRHSIDRIPVKEKGNYKKLFNGLKDDIELKELKLQQAARIFYFDIEPERTLYVVAITNNHLETNKNRR